MAELISIGMPATSPATAAWAGRFCDVLGRRLHVPVSVVPAQSYTELSDNLAEGRVDLAWLPPLEAVQLYRYAGVDLILQMSRHAGGDYHSLVFVRDDSGIRTAEDLTDVSLAYVHYRSASGYIVAAAHLLKFGIGPHSPASFLGSHGDVVQAVANGHFTAGATFGVVTERDEGVEVSSCGWDEHPPDPSCRMRVVTWAGPVPPDAICAWPGTSKLLRRAFIEALNAAAETPEEASVIDGIFGTTHFVEPDLAKYELLDAALFELRSARR